MAIVLAEAKAEQLRDAMLSDAAVLPAPVLTEVWLVTGNNIDGRQGRAKVLVDALIAKGTVIVPFQHRHADITALARNSYGKGNGHGGKLNFGDLMVYAIAKDSGLPLLCTGNDFTTTDLVIHPASRLDP